MKSDNQFIDQILGQMPGIRDRTWRQLQHSLNMRLYEQIDGSLPGSQIGNRLQDHLDGKIQR